MATSKLARFFVTILALLYVSAPAGATESGVVLDPAGDANGSALVELLTLGRVSLPPGGYSYAPADLRKVWFSTDYETIEDASGVIQYIITGVTLHFETEEPFDKSGSSVLYRLQAELSDDGCASYFVVELAGEAIGSTDEDAAWWEIIDCETTPNGGTVYSDPRWTVSQTGKEISMSLPFDTLNSSQQQLLFPGAVISSFSARSQLEVYIYPYLDTTSSGSFVVGEDVPSA